MAGTRGIGAGTGTKWGRAGGRRRGRARRAARDYHRVTSAHPLVPKIDVGVQPLFRTRAGNMKGSKIGRFSEAEIGLSRREKISTSILYIILRKHGASAIALHAHEELDDLVHLPHILTVVGHSFTAKYRFRMH
jgi:hypothetical protein